MPDRYFLLAVDYATGTVCAGEIRAEWPEPLSAACLVPVIPGHSCVENGGDDVAEIASAAADALRSVMPEPLDVTAPPIPEPSKVSRETPIGSPVLADVAEYPRGYAQGETPTGETATGTLWGVEGDAGIAWCFVKVDDPGDGPEYMHVPMDRVKVVSQPA